MSFSQAPQRRWPSQPSLVYDCLILQPTLRKLRPRPSCTDPSQAITDGNCNLWSAIAKTQGAGQRMDFAYQNTYPKMFSRFVFGR